MIFDPGDEGVEHVYHELVVEKADYHNYCQKGEENQMRDYFDAGVRFFAGLLLLALLISLGLQRFESLGGAYVPSIQPIFILLSFWIEEAVFIVKVNMIK